MHGLVMSAWLLLLLVQVGLIRVGRRIGIDVWALSACCSRRQSS
jgi:hypothetical protein